MLEAVEGEVSGSVTVAVAVAVTVSNCSRDSGIGDYCSRTQHRIQHRIQQDTSRTVKSQITIDTLNRHDQAMRRPDMQHPASKDSKYPDTRNHLYSSTFKTQHRNLISLYPAPLTEPISLGHRISSHRHRHRHLHRLASARRRPAPTCIDRQRPDHRLSLRPHTSCSSNQEASTSITAHTRPKTCASPVLLLQKPLSSRGTSAVHQHQKL